MLKSSSIAWLLLLLGTPVLAGEITHPEPAAFAGYGETYGSYMGIDTQEVTPDRVQALRLREEAGAEITMVDHDAPAGKAGLREHDVILQFNGTKVQGVEELRRLIHETPPGRTVQLGIWRDGQPTNLSVQLVDKKQYFAQNPGKLQEHGIPPIPPIPPIPDLKIGISAPIHGLVVDNLTPQLGEYFGVKNGEGVLVKSVEDGTPAKAAGFKAGDVIVRVGNQKIADRGDWRSAIRTQRSGKIAVGIVRDRHQQTLTLNLPETKRDQSKVEVELPVLPSIDLDLGQDLTQLQAELRDLRPELERARSEMLKETRDALEATRQTMNASEKELRRATDRARIILDHEMKQYEKELKKAESEHRPRD